MKFISLIACFSFALVASANNPEHPACREKKLIIGKSANNFEQARRRASYDASFPCFRLAREHNCGGYPVRVSDWELKKETYPCGGGRYDCEVYVASAEFVCR